ncbi:MAG TPA: sulfatase [Candidatus Lokiarchaeia archaeon]|nr:sulfatase [Candidatus Lokiarchaeia archaeon]
MAQRPNFLYIMSDDHAFHAISSYTRRGNQRQQINKTPNIDRIADEGMLFENCFCTNAICTPSRAVILTGKYNHHPLNGVKTFLPMDNRLPTVAKDLQANGYQTAIFGKWHLGLGPDHCPTGFDAWKVLPGQGDYFDPVFLENDGGATPGGNPVKETGYVTDLITDFTMNWLEQRDEQKPFFLMCHHKAPHRPWLVDKKHAAMFKDVDLPAPASFNDDYSSSEAKKNARMRIDRDFDAGDVKVIPNIGTGLHERLHVPDPRDLDSYELEPYDPLTEEPTGEIIRFDSLEERKNWLYQRYLKDYLRVVAAIDDNVGRLLSCLEDLGILDDTIIMYTSDQGFFLGDHGWYDKRFMYEESLRMPFLVRYPPEISAGSVNSDLVLNVDFAETWLDYAGVAIPPEMQGQSIRPLLQGNIPVDWRTSMYYRYWMEGDGAHDTTAHYGIRTVGPARKEMKLIFYYADGMGITDCNQWKPDTSRGEVAVPHPREWECFDLEEDPYELKNIYSEPEYQAIVVDLKKELKKLQFDLGDESYEESQ